MPYDRRVLFPRSSTVLLTCCLLVGVAACDTGDGRSLPPARADQNLTIATTTTVAPDSSASTDDAGAISDAFSEDTVAPAGGASSLTASAAGWDDGQPIPVDNSCEGADRSPAINWYDPPAGTVEIAVVMTDRDAPGFVHWTAFGLDPKLGGLAEGDSATLPSQAVNGFGKVGYSGPCPPSGTHTYVIEVYALGQQLELPSGGAATEAVDQISAVAIGSASITGTYTAT